MKALFLGRKPAAAAALRYLVERGVRVVAVVAPPPERGAEVFWRPTVRETAAELGIPLVSDDDIYADIEALRGGTSPTLPIADVDLVISFLFWKKIRGPLIELPRLGCFNFHPGPLPDFRAMRGYNFAILEGSVEYGATVHWVDARFDTGDLVEVRTFPMAPDETALSLEHRTLECLGGMFRDFVARVQRGEPIPSVPQGPGRSATKREMLDAMSIRPTDSPEVVARKVRAFWYPPHTGATIQVGGVPYTLVDPDTLKKLGAFIHGSRRSPW